MAVFSTMTFLSSVCLPKSTSAASPKQTLVALDNKPTDDFFEGLVGGAASRASKEILLHPLDTIRARQQTPSYTSTNTTNLSDLYKGIQPALVGGIPAGAVFFGVKDSSRRILRQAGLSKPAATVASVVIANIPYWIIRTPAEVLKTRKQVDMNSSFAGVLSSYESFGSNLAYALPADITKFVAYEFLKDSVLQKDEGAKVEGLEAAVVGSLASLAAQLVTTPLDVARTRVMTADASSPNPLAVMAKVGREEGFGALVAGAGPRSLRALASGSIQFASYELSKNFFHQS